MKKIISVVMAAAVALTAIPALAAQEEVNVVPGQTLEAGAATAEQAIALAKTLFSIPAELTECDYRVNDSRGAQVFDITWSDPDREKSVSVTVNSRMVPIAYRNYTFEDERRLTDTRKSQRLETAKAFLQSIVPQLADKLVYSEKESSSVNLCFNRYENGVRVEGSYANVNVSRTNNQVRSYSLTWDFDNSFTATGGIDEGSAYSILDNAAVRTEYRIFGEKAFPVYIYNDNIYVDAFGNTFEPTPLYYAYKLMNAAASTEDAAAKVAASGGEGGYRLTEQEISAVDKMNSLISRERIETILASMPELSLPDEYELGLRYYSQRMSRENGEEKVSYYVDCEFEGDGGYASMTLNAETGELLRFYSWNDRDNLVVREAGDLTDSVATPAYDEEKCASIARGFIQKIKNLDGYREDAEGEYFSYSNGGGYIRYIDGIPFPQDFKTATVSDATGLIIRYNESVPDVEIVTPASMADRLSAVKNAYTAEPVYTYASETGADGKEVIRVVLARKLTPNLDFYALRAEDGAPVDYSGEYPQSAAPKSDETGHRAWNAFDILRENDITLPGGYSFDDEISKADFRDLIGQLTRIDAVPYRYVRIEEEAEISAAPITREEGAKIVAQQFSWDPLIDLNIYSTQFADASAFTGGIGAAAILCGLGVMDCDENGSFRPGEKLTYGDAYIIAYDLARLDIYSDN